MNTKSIRGFTLAAAALVLGGCGMAPKNAEEFRQATRDGERMGLASIETFEVERPFRDVTATLQKKVDECLKVDVNWTARNSYGNTRSGVQSYKPTFVATTSKTELHLQRKRSGGGQVDVGSPPDGFYQVVLDATSVSKNRTRIDIFTQSKDNDIVRRAMRGWAQGNNLGCPDLTQR